MKGGRVIIDKPKVAIGYVIEQFIHAHGWEVYVPDWPKVGKAALRWFDAQMEGRLDSTVLLIDVADSIVCSECMVGEGVPCVGSRRHDARYDSALAAVEAVRKYILFDPKPKELEDE